MSTRTRLVLLPGMDGTGQLFAPFVSALGAAVETEVVSYPTDEPLGYSLLEQRVRDVLPQRDDYLLVAESFSGPIAVSIAAAPPAGLRGVVLSASFVSNPRPGLRLLRHLLPVLPMGPPLAVLTGALLGRHATPSLESALARALQMVQPQVLRERLRAVATVDVSTALACGGVPVLYLRATEDRVVPPAAAQRIKNLLPRATITDIVAPHMVLQTAPGVAAGHVTAFARGIVR